MNKLAILLIFVGFSAFGQTQNSINDSINDRNNALILKFGINLVDSTGERDPLDFFSVSDQMAFSNNYNVELEYRFSRVFSLAGIYSSNQWKANKGNIDGEIVGSNIEYLALDLDLKYYFSQDFERLKGIDWLDLYVHGGLGMVNVANDSDVSFNAGLGTNFWISENFGLNLSATAKWASKHPDIKYNTNHYQSSASLMYRFTDMDYDNDGVKNKFDDCPNVRGTSQNNGCPEENYDRDGDGVTDAIDNCPDVFGTDLGCPKKLIDTDGDSVVDSEDQCPKIKGLPTNMGCPLPDSDNDGIVDAADACPNTPGVESNNGCPFEALELVDLLSEHIYFNLDGYDFTQDSNFTLMKIIEFVKQYPQTKFKLSGHTDNLGPQEYNMLLSQKRVNGVRDYLTENGVPTSNLIINWFGESKPIASNSTKLGRLQNRRVEITMIRE